MVKVFKEFKDEWEAIRKASEVVIKSKKPSQEAMVNIVKKMVESTSRSTSNNILQAAFFEYSKIIIGLELNLKSKIHDLDIKDDLVRLKKMEIIQPLIKKNFVDNVVDNQSLTKSMIVNDIKTMVEDMNPKERSLMMDSMYHVLHNYNSNIEKQIIAINSADSIFIRNNQDDVSIDQKTKRNDKDLKV